MIDEKGFRENVGIILLNDSEKILCGRRVGMLIWQMPQGGIEEGETPEQAMYRELREEIGVEGSNVELLGHTEDWLYYRVPKKYRRRKGMPRCIGQKQIWFLLKFTGIDCQIKLNLHEPQEFEEWDWFDYWQPMQMVVDFKREVYRDALTQLRRFV